MKTLKILPFFLLAALLLAACSPSVFPGPGGSVTLVPTQAAAPAQPSPTLAPTAAPSATLGAVNTPTGGTTPTAGPKSPQGSVVIPPEAADAVKAAQAFVAQQLGVTPDKVQLASVEAVEWPDGCLGVVIPGRMCTQVITPGFKIMVDASGQQLELHTDQAGGQVIPAVQALPQTSGKALVWQQTVSGACTRAEIGVDGVAVGPCGGTLTEAKLDAGRVTELNELISTYSSFSATTKAGLVEFNSTGTQEATDAEKRSIGEWAKLVVQEAQSGRSGAAWGLAFSWHQEGGIAGLCNDLGVYMSGWAMPNSCKPGKIVALKEYRLTADELAQLYAFVDQYKNFEYGQKDAAVADAMKTTVIFSGLGAPMATAAEQSKVADFGTQLFANASKISQ